ncbi:MAG: hypothetical protein M3315_06360 [Actinomycetota bacterium]|nr:hypothetical protein [Actinomycetota bacterium]
MSNPFGSAQDPRVKRAIEAELVGDLLLVAQRLVEAVRDIGGETGDAGIDGAAVIAHRVLQQLEEE